jgi:hypothetical protein
MKHELLKIAAEEASNVYVHADFQVGPRKTVEFSIIERVLSDGSPLNVLAIRGTDELADWWKNFDMRSECGWKKAAYDAAIIICEKTHYIYREYAHLLITGHSKAGPTAMAYLDSILLIRKQFMGNYTGESLETYCVAFEPARGLRNNVDIKLENTVIIKDPDSIVTKVGWSRFKHPETEVITLPDDKWFPSITQHGMKHLKQYIDNMEIK